MESPRITVWLGSFLLGKSQVESISFCGKEILGIEYRFWEGWTAHMHIDMWVCVFWNKHKHIYINSKYICIYMFTVCVYIYKYISTVYLHIYIIIIIYIYYVCVCRLTYNNYSRWRFRVSIKYKLEWCFRGWKHLGTYDGPASGIRVTTASD